MDQSTAGSAVLALPGDNGTRLKVVEVIRGEIPAEGTIEPSWVIGLDRGAAVSVKPLLLIRAHNWQSWANVGAIGVEYAAWLRRISATKPTANMTDAEWQDEAALVLPYLENVEPLVAEIAYGELARAPYSALRSLKGRLDPQALRQWTADPKLAKRQSLYTLLLGIGGDAADAARIEEWLTAAWKATDATNLGPCLQPTLSCVVLTHGMDRRQVHRRSRSNEARTRSGIARSQRSRRCERHDSAGAHYRILQIFIDVHRPFAGFVAQDLAAWNYWDVGPAVHCTDASDLAQHPASRYAMWSYLKQSPRADAKAAVDALASSRQ